MLEFVFEFSRVIVANREGRRRMEEKLQFKNFLSVHQSPLKQKRTTYVFYLDIFNFHWGSSFLCPPRLRCLCLSLSLFSFSFVFSMWLFKHLNWGVCSFKFQHEGVFFLAASSAEEAAGVVCLEINRGRCFNQLFLYFLFYPLHFSFSFSCRTFKNTLFWGFLPGISWLRNYCWKLTD